MFRLAHITDLHARHHQPGTSRISERRSRLMPELFEQALADIRARGADAVAVTGDLLDVPGYILEHDDYYDYDRAFWATAVEADYRLFRDLLEASGLPYFVMPGNHDQIPIMASVFPHEPVVDLGGYRFVTFWDRDFYAHMPRRFDRERRLMEQVLRGDGPPQIHLQHYVITPELNQHWPHTYLEGEQLLARLTGSERVVLSLSGHYHRGTDLLSHGRCSLTAAPAFAEFPHPYRIYEIDRERVEMETVNLLERPKEAGRQAVFLDRDGVLNIEPSWQTGPEGLLPVPGVGQALRRLHEAGYALVVISSQSAVGYGYVTESVVDSVFDRLARFLWEEAGVCFDAFYYSTGAGEQACHPRFAPTETAKPSPYFLNAARDRFRLDLSGSYMVGDTAGDLTAGLAAGVTPILVRTGHGRTTEARLADHGLAEVQVVDDIGAAAEAIMASRVAARAGE